MSSVRPASNGTAKVRILPGNSTPEKLSPVSIGYPCSLRPNAFDAVIPLMATTINNVGDPEMSSNFASNSHVTELQVLRYFMDLLRIKPEGAWGYITFSGTEGNLQGLYTAREAFPDGVLYVSRDSHYSLMKIARLLNLELCLVRSLDSGAIDCEDLDAQIKARGDRAVIISANVGTTMKGAIDDTSSIFRVLVKRDKLKKYYLHLDAALSGFFLPFLDKDLSFLKHAHSLAISGHKYLGVPFPCGIFLMERRLLDIISKPVEYIGSVDNTISGSRNGHAPLFLHQILTSVSHEEWQREIEDCVARSEYLIEELLAKVPPTEPWRNHLSVTVVLQRPPMQLVKKWSLAVQDSLAHVVVLPHVTTEVIDAFVSDLEAVFKAQGASGFGASQIPTAASSGSSASSSVPDSTKLQAPESEPSGPLESDSTGEEASDSTMRPMPSSSQGPEVVCEIPPSGRTDLAAVPSSSILPSGAGPSSDAAKPVEIQPFIVGKRPVVTGVGVLQRRRSFGPEESDSVSYRSPSGPGRLPHAHTYSAASSSSAAAPSSHHREESSSSLPASLASSLKNGNPRASLDESVRGVKVGKAESDHLHQA